MSPMCRNPTTLVVMGVLIRSHELATLRGCDQKVSRLFVLSIAGAIQCETILLRVRITTGPGSSMTANSPSSPRSMKRDDQHMDMIPAFYQGLIFFCFALLVDDSTNRVNQDRGHIYQPTLQKLDLEMSAIYALLLEFAGATAMILESD